MSRRTAVLVVLLIGMTGEAYGEPGMACSRTPAPPELDGRLDDGAWTQLRPFPLLGIAGETAVEPQTLLRLCTDEDWLYLAVEARDPGAAGLSRDVRARDGITFSESVEVFLAPQLDQPLYYHFAVDPAGTLYDNIGQSQATDNNFGWRCAVRVGADGWVAEMALPWKELGRPAGVQDGDCVALNVCRTTRQGTRYQCWSPTGSSYHRRDRFGTLVVGTLNGEATRRTGLLEARYAGIGAAAGDPLATEVAQELAVLRTQASAVRDSAAWGRFRSGWLRTEKRLRRLAGRGVNRLLVWRCNPWGLPDREAAMPEGDLPDSLQLTALQDEYLSAALAVANPTDKPVRLRCLAETLRSSDWQQAPEGTHPVSLHRVEEVAVRGGGSQRDPLPSLRTEDPMVILPGENEIVWITVDTHGLEAGAWSTRIDFVPLVRYGLGCSVTLTLRVLPAALPQGPRPYSCNWASYRFAPSGGRSRRACCEDQKRHYTNVHIVGAGETGLRSLLFDAEGRSLNQPDFSLLDGHWLDVFGSDGQFYIVAIRYGHLPPEMDGVGEHAEREHEAFASFANAIRGHFAERGVGVEDFAWYITDEPDVRRAQLAARLGKLLHAADPEQQMFATLYSSTPMEALRILLPYVNVWVPAFSSTKEQMDLLRTEGLPARFLSYNVHSRTISPYRYRSSATTAWQLGYEGIGFWSYDDSGGTHSSSTWTDLDDSNPSNSRGEKRSDYAVIYEGSQGPVSSVRWEAWRHGIQDYRYLDWLTAMAERCPDKALASEAKQAVSEGVKSILKGGDTTRPDRFNDRARTLSVRLLGAVGELSADDVARVVDPLPLCLTGNGRLLANAGLGGGYRYNSFPSGTYGELASGNGQVPFSARGNAAAGRLTDGNLKYADGWVIHPRPPDPWVLTFDLAGLCRLDAMLVYIDTNPSVRNYKSMGVELCEDTDGAAWESVYRADMTDVRAVPVTHDTALRVPLQGRRARHVRLTVGTCGEPSRLGEVRVIGWPVEEEARE